MPDYIWTIPGQTGARRAEKCLDLLGQGPYTAQVRGNTSKQAKMTCILRRAVRPTHSEIGALRRNTPLGINPGQT